ncbi:MAG: aminotransferase class V-fold PLP-dependent enzyme [Simkaniaceae bacterium]|nr:aminotransferase class V-fold PLP-dependent enzyme [Candidatus Sacchlamyda saccharinae]
MADWIFLDHHTKTRPLAELTAQFAKMSQEHWLVGPTGHAQDKILTELGVVEANISLKASLADAHDHVLFSHYIDSIRQTGRTHILALENEQQSILSAIKGLEKFDVQGKLLPVDERGHLTKQALSKALRARTSILSISWAHPKTGVIQPIHDLIEVCKENDIAIHLDISSAIGKLYFQHLDVDYITFDGGLLGLPFPLGVVLSTGKSLEGSYAQYANLATALKHQVDQIETYAMEIAHLRDVLEEKLKTLGATIPFQDSMRLPNVAAAQFPDIHAEQITYLLQKEGVFASVADPYTVSFALNYDTKREEIDRLLEIFPSVLQKLQTKQKLFTAEDAKAKNMRLCTATLGEKKEGRQFTLSLLVDEEDGVIADARAESFGPPALSDALKSATDELIRKNYMQARRMTADLIEKNMAFPADSLALNLIIDAIDLSTENCMDIPIEDIYVAPPEMEGGERTEYPGWEALSNEKKKAVIAAVMETDIQPYVELDAGGVEVMKVEDNRITIAYSGNCTSCHSATGATLDAIGNILRHKIFPDLMVIPDLSLLNG